MVRAFEWMNVSLAMASHIRLHYPYNFKMINPAILSTDTIGGKAKWAIVKSFLLSVPAMTLSTSGTMKRQTDKFQYLIRLLPESKWTMQSPGELSYR